MNAQPAGGENEIGAGLALATARWLDLRTTDGNHYVSPYQASQALHRAAQNRPTVTAEVDVPTFLVREDGTSRITIYTGGDDVTVSNRKGDFKFNIRTRHLCACEGTDDNGDPCLGRRGNDDGDYTGSLCKVNHPATPSMPLVPVREGTEFHRIVRAPLMTAQGIVYQLRSNGGLISLRERVGGGSRGLNADCPEYRKNRDFRTVGGCPSCGRGQCWGKVKKTGLECWPAFEFAMVNVAGAGWTEAAIDPSRSDYDDVLSILDSMGSKTSDRPIITGGAA